VPVRLPVRLYIGARRPATVDAVETGNDGPGLTEITRDGDVWHLTMSGVTEAGVVGQYLWPMVPLPDGVDIDAVIVVTEPAQVGRFELRGLTPAALSAMEPWHAYWFAQLGAQAAAPAAEAKTPVRSLRIWFKVFIPQERVDGPPFYACFAGDNRSFSDDVAAPARMHSEVVIDNLYGETPTMTQHHWCGETHEVSCSDGSVIDSATAGTEMMQFYNFRHPGATVWDWDQAHPPAAHPPEVEVPDDAPVTVDYVGKGANPLVPTAPLIDLWAKISYDRQNHVLTIEGAVDDFPAYEGYVSWTGGPGDGDEVVFTFDPSPDGPNALFGSANRGFTWHIGLKPG